jgi:tRNA nucleotidyltransferase/poly(A) polymerase
MAKQKAQANNRRRLKAAAKGKARKEKLRKARAAEQAREHEQALAKKNWPPERIFSQADELFWRCHGVNYLVSDTDEGLWKPLFPTIYEGFGPAPEDIVKTILASGEESPDPIAWSAQPRASIYAIRQRCITRIKSDAKKELTREEIEERLVKPHDPSVWDVFFDLKESLRRRREARAPAFAAETIENVTKQEAEEPQAEKDHCEHGVVGGCEVNCENCGHTCKRHMGGICDHEGLVTCRCDDYKGTSG